jgi:hypothetical protein
VYSKMSDLSQLGCVSYPTHEVEQLRVLDERIKDVSLCHCEMYKESRGMWIQSRISHKRT